MKRALLITAFFAALILLWKAATVFMGWSPLLLPPPEAVARYLWDALLDGTLFSASIVTVKRLLIGYFIGVAIGMGLGLMVSTSDLFNSTIGALALGLQTLPSVCWVPLALLWGRSLMAAEVYVTILTGFGLGHLLEYGRELSAMDQVIGVMIVIVVIGLITDKGLFAPWERFMHRRWGTGASVS
jgi:ABC-type nitrate/sulfonate/bicarbonate transport system permease component